METCVRLIPVSEERNRIQQFPNKPCAQSPHICHCCSSIIMVFLFHILTSAKGYADNLKIAWLVSVACRYAADTLTVISGMQIRCRYPDWCQWYADTLKIPWPVLRVYRYPGNTLTGVRGMQISWRYPDWCCISSQVSMNKHNLINNQIRHKI